MFNKKRVLTAAVLLSCSFFMAPYYAHAEEEKPSCDHPSSYMTVEAGNLTYNFDIYNASTHPGPHWRGEYEEDDNGDAILDANGQKIKAYTSYRSLFTNEEKAFGESIAYIHKMLNPTKAFSPTIKLELLPEKDANAAASSETHITYDSNGKPVQISDTKLAAVLQGKYKPKDNDIVAEIEIDLAPDGTSWYIDKFPILPSNGLNSDYYGTIAHEMFHALGLVANVSADTSGDITFGTSGNYDDGGYLRSRAVFNKYEMGIRDVFGRVAYYAAYKNDNDEYFYTYFDGNEGQSQPINPNETPTTINGELVSRNIVGITVSQYNEMLSGTTPIDPFTFYVLKDAQAESEEDGPESGEEVASFDASISTGLPEGTKIDQYCGAYFTGKNVEQVLNGAKIAWPDDSKVLAVPGLPLNGYEGDDATSPEMSHIELQNGQMSHQNYRNWCSFMEAELALMQDLGYDIDRGAYFGKSVYNSDLTYENTQGFFKREQQADGTWVYVDDKPSTQIHGIGLHIYGSNNTITQTGKILADGYSGIGIRVDGVENKVTIDSNITANGAYGNGLLVAYGKNHEITLNSGKSIEAKGEDGVAARFDFGSNELGDQAGYRGSYINTKYTSQEEIDERAKENPEAAAEMQVGWSEITIDDLPTAIQGALVDNFNVAGKLVGKKAAIYISPNAYVKEINILDTADIQGHIISDWNPNEIIYQNEASDEEEGSVLKPLFLNGEDGMTHLNFGYTADENGGLQVDGNYKKTIGNNISGKESFSIDLWAGQLTTTGTNTVNIVHVAQDYMNNVSETMPTKYINTGDLTINSSLAVDGTFINEGKLQSFFDSDGESMKISGSGEAFLTGQENNNGTFILNAEEGLYKDTTTIELVNDTAGTPTIGLNNDNLLVNSNSATLQMTAEYDQDDSIITISTARNYTPFAGTSAEAQIAAQLAEKASALANESEESLSELDQKWVNLLTGMDYNDSTGATARQALHALNPHVYSSSAQATLNTHSMLNNLNMLGNFSNNVPAARTGGGRGPAAEAAPKHNTWRNIVVPFASYSDQHNGVSSYINHNSGVLGAMERTLDNGLTHGYHAAVNHQSTSSGGQRIKGEGFYIGTQASYALADWNGWQIFGSARLGLENMRSHRNLAIAGGSMGTSDADWTGFSGSFTVGTALEKEHGVVKSGPFAALGYSFAHRPSVDEHGSGFPAHLDSTTYDSLKTQLGYRLTTAPKALDNYDSTKWQAHASVAWNHELLSDNGSTDFALEGLSKTINDKTTDYGRDSMSVAAGVTFKTPKKLDVGLTLGSDIYRKGGSSVYGKVNFEWKF